MKYLLDVSALLPLVTRRGRQLIVEAGEVELLTTDLAMYEASNSLWKLATLLKTISIDDAAIAAAALKETASKRLIQTVTFDKLDFFKTVELAHKERLTFYDASYVVLAQDTQATLVTEDVKMRKIAGKFVRTEDYCSLEKKLTKESR